MKTKNMLKYTSLLIIGLSCFIFNQAYSQYDQTIYNLPTVIQKNQQNPAFIPKMDYHFGVPGLSSTYVGFGNSGFKYTDLFKKRGDDSLLLNTSGFLNALGNRNNIHFNASEQWINAGYKWKEFYFSLSVSDVVDFKMNFPKEVVKFGLMGNGAFIGETADLSGMAIRYLHYREYALGAAWELDKKTNVGAKVKFLFGKSGINSKNIDAKLTTTENTFLITSESDILINTSLPGSWTDDSQEKIKNSKYMFYGGNFGVAFDLGGTYKYDDKISFSASVLDLGFIGFNRYTKNYSNKTPTWSFEGIDLWNFDGLDSTAINNELENVGDSLMDKFNLTTDNDKFRTMLTAKIYIGGNYKISDKENVGFLIRSEVYDKLWIPAFTASYSYKFDEHLSLIGSYTVASRSYFNLGVGAVYNWAPVQVFLTTDNFIGVFVPDMVKFTNIHFGVNIIFPQKTASRSLID